MKLSSIKSKCFLIALVILIQTVGFSMQAQRAPSAWRTQDQTPKEDMTLTYALLGGGIVIGIIVGVIIYKKKKNTDKTSSFKVPKNTQIQNEYSFNDLKINKAQEFNNTQSMTNNVRLNSSIIELGGISGKVENEYSNSNEVNYTIVEKYISPFDRIAFNLNEVNTFKSAVFDKFDYRRSSEIDL